MDTVMGGMTSERATEPTTTREWEWDTDESLDDCGSDEEESDRVASLVGDKIRGLYDEMRGLMNLAFDECYPDPTPENEEEYFDAHVVWLDAFEGEFFDNLGVVRLVREGDFYVLTETERDDDWYVLPETERDDDGEQGEGRMIRLDNALSDEELYKQVSEFLARDPIGKTKSHCAENLRNK